MMRRENTCRRSTLTSGEAARLCDVSLQTVNRWFDSGELRGFRVGRHRRIPENELVAFIRRRGLPMPPGLLASPARATP